MDAVNRIQIVSREGNTQISEESDFSWEYCSLTAPGIMFANEKKIPKTENPDTYPIKEVPLSLTEEAAIQWSSECCQGHLVIPFFASVLEPFTQIKAAYRPSATCNMHIALQRFLSICARRLFGLSFSSISSFICHSKIHTNSTLLHLIPYIQFARSTRKNYLFWCKVRCGQREKLHQGRKEA